MKHFAALVLLLCATAVLPYPASGAISPQEAEKAMKADTVMQGFYQQPDPVKIDEILALLETFKPELLNKSSRIWQVFFTEIFRKYPQNAAAWKKSVKNRKVRRILERAAAGAKSPQMKLDDETARNMSPDMLDDCWAAFFASGDRKYVDWISAAALNFPAGGDGINLSQRAALWSLLSLIEKHPQIKACFRENSKKSYPQVQYALAKEISESQQEELLGRVLIPNRQKDENDTEEQKRPKSEIIEAGRLKEPYFDFIKTAPLNYESDYLNDLHKLVLAECKRRFAGISQDEAEKLAWNLLLLKSSQVPSRTGDEAGFVEFLSMWIYMNEKSSTARQRQIFFQYGLKLAQKYPDNIRAAQLVFRGGDAIGFNFSRFKIESLDSMKIHPWLKLMLKGRYYRNLAWKHRGGGYAETVPTHGWQSFRENMNKARPCVEQACREYPQAPEAFAAMIGIACVSGGDGEDAAVWLKRALRAQADYRGTMETYTWYNRPRWGGSAAELLSDARGFLALEEKNPKMAQNGLFLLQAYLAEIPLIDNFRYFAAPVHFDRIAGIFELLDKETPLDSSQKLFLGTAALLSGNWEAADRIAESLTAEDMEFAGKMKWQEGRIPSIYWIDFPKLNSALKNTGLREELVSSLHWNGAGVALTQLEKAIASPDTSSADKQILIDLYAGLKCRIDLLIGRKNMPFLLRLCAQPEENMGLIKKMIEMGSDIEARDFTGIQSPLNYALRNKEDNGALLDLLLKAGANPNGQVGEYHLLDYAVRKHYPAANIRRLLEAGADPNLKYRKTFSPLHAAYGNLEGAKLLVEFGARLNEVSEFGQTPLDLAEKLGSPEVVRFLISKGAKHAREL